MLRQGVETAQTINPGTKTDTVGPGAEPASPSHAAMPASASEQSQIGAAAPTAPAKAVQPPQATPATAAASESKPTAGAAEPAPAPPPKAATTAQGNGAASAPPATPAMPEKDGAAQASPSSAPAASAPADLGSPVNAAASANIAAPVEDVPLPLSKPTRIAEGISGPLAIFISRKEGKIYVRQNFTPLFDAPIKIDHPDQPLGTHVFTAMDYLPDHSTFRWTVVTYPRMAAKATEHWKYVKDRTGRRRRVRVEEPAAATAVMGPPETPQGALARIEIPQDVIDQISRLIVPGSSLTISDQGLGSETGDATDFIVVMR
jgi:hypothetical protein